MLFNSVEFLFGFLPVVFAGYFGLLSIQAHQSAKIWLLAASLFFYSYWDLAYLPLLLGSILFNFSAGLLLQRLGRRQAKVILAIAIVSNLAFLGYYKYADFLIENLNLVFDTHYSMLRLLLPLAISFFTFQQIAYLVDSYRGQVQERSLLDYAIFVAFFPQLIAGPIVHHKQMMPQFAKIHLSRINFANIFVGLLLLGIGLFKKSVIADQFQPWVAAGYSNTEGLSMVGAWAVSLGFSMQLVFDFTAYADMAIGIALLFNIRLPINFYSSAKSQNIQQFWERWHLTLTAFLRDYVYVPLGGNRKGFSRTNVNFFVVFLLAGIWHGAGWTFVMWGALQGAAFVIYRLWKAQGYSMHPLLGWFITFNFLNVICICFRAPTLADASNVLLGMAGFHGVFPDSYVWNAGDGVLIEQLLVEVAADWQLVIWLAVSLAVVLGARNSMEIASTARINLRTALYTGFLIGFAALTLFEQPDEFIYFNF